MGNYKCIDKLRPWLCEKGVQRPPFFFSISCFNLLHCSNKHVPELNYRFLNCRIRYSGYHEFRNHGKPLSWDSLRITLVKDIRDIVFFINGYIPVMEVHMTQLK